MNDWKQIEEQEQALQKEAERAAAELQKQVEAKTAAIQFQRDAYRLRLAFDLGLARGTQQLLLGVKAIVEHGQYAAPSDTPELFTYAEELQPLADFYGVRIVESETHKGVSHVELKA